MWNNGLLDHSFLWKWSQSVFYRKSCRLLLNMKVSHLQGLQIHMKESFRKFEKVKMWKEIKDYSVSLAWKSFVGVAGRKANLPGNIILPRGKLDVNWVKLHTAVILLQEHPGHCVSTAVTLKHWLSHPCQRAAASCGAWEMQCWKKLPGQPILKYKQWNN